MGGGVTGAIARAEQLLRSAGALLDMGDVQSSVSRSYYAMFFAAEALLITKGLSYNSHKGVSAGFGEHFVKTGVFDPQDGRALTRALDQRLKADYELAPSITRADAEALLQTAMAFVAKARDILRSSRTSG